MDESLTKSLTLAGKKARYDEHVKKILAHKSVLAHILSGAVKEYKGLDPLDIIPLMEEKPKISEVSVLPGETSSGILPMITGMNTEDKVPNEGEIVFDIRFSVWTPEKKSKRKIIINVEAQNRKPGGYDIVTRGIFYNARQLSAQLGTEFSIPHYEDMKKVYSIWICMNAPAYQENTAVLYDVQPHDLIGTSIKYGRYDLLSVIEIYLGKELAEEQELQQLHRFLGILLSSALKPDQKIRLLKQEYKMETEGILRKEMEEMCNLSDAIAEEFYGKGIEKGRLEERKNTIRERERADFAEAELKELKKELALLKAGR